MFTINNYLSVLGLYALIRLNILIYIYFRIIYKIATVYFFEYFISIVSIFNLSNIHQNTYKSRVI